MRLLQGVVACSLSLLVVLGGCRRNQPTLVDRNAAPETQLWSAPPDSSEYEYLVHLYWRGTDGDGVVERYIWTIQDTLVTDPALSWDPANRLRDFRSGRITTRTDSVFSFTAFRNVGGVGIKKNRQAFYIASIDDNGVIDPSPAAVEFVATIDKLPEIEVAVHIGSRHRHYTHRSAPADTVGMFKPFSISFHGSTENGEIRAYQWFPLSTSITLPGARVWRPWTPCDDLTGADLAACEARALQDTLVSLTNSGTQIVPSSTFRFSAQCRDDANAESPIDAGRFSEGVCQVQVNFDPDTKVDQVKSYYVFNDAVHERDINFRDAVRDTVPFKSWVWIHYAGWDDTRDSIRCSPLNSDRCINFQLNYERTSSRLPGSYGTSGWVPRGAAHDTDTTSASDSNSVNIGSVEYDFWIRAIDENLKPDGRPARVSIVGNYDPTLDNVTLQDHFGNQLDLATLDTLTWNFWKGEGWPYTSLYDTVDVTGGGSFQKRFSFRILATGHDSNLDPVGSGVKSWQYLIFDEDGNFYPLARAGETWVSGDGLNNLDDEFGLRFRYGNFFAGLDPYGDAVMSNLPAYMNRDLTVILKGRDTATDEGEFTQYMFLGTVAPGAKGVHNFAELVTLNQYPTAVFGRWTKEKRFTFHFRMIRDPAPPPAR